MGDLLPCIIGVVVKFSIPDGAILTIALRLAILLFSCCGNYPGEAACDSPFPLGLSTKCLNQNG